jgi:hypothetical protein
MQWFSETDDRITCAECARYDGDDYETQIFGTRYVFAGRCIAARPPMGTVSDVKRRCVYFNARPGAEDQRKGIERWPEMKDDPGQPNRKPYPEPKHE